ncbi:hypothetical protein J113_16275 [Mycobacterium tuberculosis CAS/NITR204]|uniref:Uncharacterized protein n=1 Tax=Mycobacterium tuberculosis CAS/NITR204 TaxID=1310114 RepID=R4MFU5_MYCTX|nr:hypothetical protein J113_16275 [Mycobacterium tuberculosis CAS/NITR204]
MSGRQAGLVDAVRAAESALGQARALLDAVGQRRHRHRHAVGLAVVADIQRSDSHTHSRRNNPKPGAPVT